MIGEALVLGETVLRGLAQIRDVDRGLEQAAGGAGQPAVSAAREEAAGLASVELPLSFSVNLMIARPPLAGVAAMDGTPGLAFAETYPWLSACTCRSCERAVPLPSTCALWISRWPRRMSARSGCGASRHRPCACATCVRNSPLELIPPSGRGPLWWAVARWRWSPCPAVRPGLLRTDRGLLTVHCQFGIEAAVHAGEQLAGDRMAALEPPQPLV